MNKMVEQVPAHWEEINGGPYIAADDLLTFMGSINTTFNTSTLRDWIMEAKGARLDELAELVSAADVPAMKKDLLALRDELES